MEIVNFQEKIHDPKVIATFDVYLGANSTVVYPNFKVLKGKTGGTYIARPGYVKSQDENGNKVFGNYPEMSAEKWKSLSTQLDEMLKPFLKKTEPLF